MMVVMIAVCVKWEYPNRPVTVPPAVFFSPHATLLTTPRDMALKALVGMINMSKARRRFPKGSAVSGVKHLDAYGNVWSLRIFPNGHASSKENMVAVTIYLESMATDVAAVKLTWDGVTVKNEKGEVVVQVGLSAPPFPPRVLTTFSTAAQGH
jgi:hypothetical protein